MDKVRVLLVDDQNLITESFKVLLETECEDFEILGSAHDGAEAVKMATLLKPDIVLMDVRMPVMDGVESTRLIKEKEPGTKVIMLTTFDDDDFVVAAIRYGAAGYLLKDISTKELVTAIRSVHEGSVLLSRRAAEAIAQGRGGPLIGRIERRQGPDPRILDELSPRELEILKLIALGHENKEIAIDLGMAEQTVKNSVSRIYQKLAVDSRTEARKLALGLGLVSRDRG
jgi:DNA-binding NarL/FixJ family response regulator